MRYFWTRRDPDLTRVLLIESGSRHLSEGVRPHLQNMWGEEVEIDILSCYAGLPRNYPETTRIFNVQNYGSPAGRQRLIGELKSRHYSFAAMICSAEPIMTKWKWLVFVQVPAKFLIVNENGDYFWVHRDRIDTMRHFMLVRAGLAGAGAARTFARLLIFPFSLLSLILYAAAVHVRRALRLAIH